MSKTNSKADFFFQKAGKWQSAFEKLRNIAVSTELTEDLKWGCPCYLEDSIRKYIFNAVEIEESGAKVEMKPTKAIEMPEEFRQKVETDAVLKTAFEALTPGRQRAYLLYFSSAKQSKTKQSRIEKYIPEILAGKGLND